MDAVQFDYDTYLEKLHLSDNDIGEALSDNAAMLGFYGYQQGKWEAKAALNKVRLKNRESEVAQTIRAEDGKVAQTTIAARIPLDTVVKALEQRLVLDREQETLYSNAFKAFLDRGNNARSKNTTQRVERANYNGNSYSVDSETRSHSHEENKERAKRYVAKE